jgi:hypothetical protein
MDLLEAFRRPTRRLTPQRRDAKLREWAMQKFKGFRLDYQAILDSEPDDDSDDSNQ